jgi:hypothetical protein
MVSLLGLKKRRFCVRRGQVLELASFEDGILGLTRRKIRLNSPSFRNATALRLLRCAIGAVGESNFRKSLVLKPIESTVFVHSFREFSCIAIYLSFNGQIRGR